MRWDPEAYLGFADERGRPYADLLARVGAEDPGRVVDLGCGPGNLTATLARRWPRAAVHGLDSSPEMVARAREEHAGPRVTFELGDLRDWRPRSPVDVLVCNATLQWVPGHAALLPGLVGQVRPGGWLAFQVPGNFGERSHTAMAEVAASPRWAPVFAGHDPARPAVEPAQTYLELLAALGTTVDAWETTYLHVLTGEDAVVRWVTGTGLRPYLQALDDDAQRADFVADYRALLAPAYPSHAWGTVLPFRRVFVVARRTA